MFNSFQSFLDGPVDMEDFYDLKPSTGGSSIGSKHAPIDILEGTGLSIQHLLTDTQKLRE